jgi:hypothetical protein
MRRSSSPDARGTPALTSARTFRRREEITAGQIRRAVRLGATRPNQVKEFIRCGTGPAGAAVRADSQRRDRPRARSADQRSQHLPATRATQADHLGAVAVVEAKPHQIAE